MYNFKKTDSKWKEKLSSCYLSDSDISNKEKYYILEMLPYPSGKLHMGHVRNYAIGDVVARFKKMQGYAVMHPMGWDSFGLPAENAAIESGSHPLLWTNKNISEMKKQQQDLSYMYNWDREISTCSLEYYSQEQKIFLDMYKHGLAYQKESYVNWDPVEHTVLANEQVIDGKGWRSKAPIEKKLLKQWYLRITDYQQELLKGLTELNEWPTNVLKMQENWIGKSNGAIVHFHLENPFNSFTTIDVFTTRPDTLFGASFIALSPDHHLSQEIASINKDAKIFIDQCKKVKNTEEEIEKLEKKGINTNLFVKHPFDQNRKIPVYIANFVLIDYGTGAVFGCPAHDERDFAFADKYRLPIKTVIDTNEPLPYTGDGKIINSEFLNGLSIETAKQKAIEYLVENSLGKAKTIYRLRDWLISRQRYWGCPIPIIHCPKCGIVPIDDKDLPLNLPEDVEITGRGNPLEHHPTWKYVKCPKCNKDAIRDTDTLDTFFESSWYFMRYLDPHCETPINKKICDKFLPIDLYIGGIEHAILHLLYARFFTLALRDMGYVGIKHPFKRLLTQGMVCHKSYKNERGEWIYPEDVLRDPHGNLVDNEGNKVTEGPSEKMSKSKKNTVNPQKIINSHGVDSVRLFILSDTPPEKDFDWNTDALDGTWKFLNRVWRLFEKIKNIPHNKEGTDTLIKIAHTYLKKIESSFESVCLNRSVAFLRELFNKIEELVDTESGQSIHTAFDMFIKAFYPICPNITHEMFEILHNNQFLQNENWPNIDPKLACDDNITIAVQVNGKLRATFSTEINTSIENLRIEAQKVLNDTVDFNQAKKIIIVKNKVVNIVV